MEPLAKKNKEFVFRVEKSPDGKFQLKVKNEMNYLELISGLSELFSEPDYEEIKKVLNVAIRVSNKKTK